MDVSGFPYITNDTRWNILPSRVIDQDLCYVTVSWFEYVVSRVRFDSKNVKTSFKKL